MMNRRVYMARRLSVKASPEVKKELKKMDKEVKKKKEEALENTKTDDKVIDTELQNKVLNDYLPSQKIACLQKLTEFAEGVTVSDINDSSKTFMFPYKAFEFEYQKPLIESAYYVANKLILNGGRSFKDLFKLVIDEKSHYIILNQLLGSDTEINFFFMMTKEELEKGDKSFYFFGIDNRFYNLSGIDTDHKIASIDFKYFAEASYRELKKSFEMS